jgi:uncharacterized membrane protein
LPSVGESSEGAPVGRRRGYLDWLRGIAVLIMVEAHTFDAWTAPLDRNSPGYRLFILVGGFGAPAFLFLAGVAFALAVGARMRKGLAAGEAVRLARRRGWQIFGLAFLFRFQSWVISWGPALTLLKVDILNILGLSMLVAAALWGLARTRTARMALFAAAAVVVAAVAPAVRASTAIAALPDPLEWYFHPWPGRSSFTLSPWPAFLFAGVAVGEWLEGARSAPLEQRVTWQLGATGMALIAAGYAATFFPPVYDHGSLWTIAPSIVGVRLGVLLVAMPLAFAWVARRRGPSWLEEFGVSSLFVYWIHVEMVYGIVSLALHKRLTLPQVGVAYVALCVLLFLLVRLKNRMVRDWRKSGKGTSWVRIRLFIGRMRPAEGSPLGRSQETP